MEEKNAVAENVPTFLKKLRRLLLDIVIVCIKVLIFYCHRGTGSLLYQVRRYNLQLLDCFGLIEFTSKMYLKDGLGMTKTQVIGFFLLLRGVFVIARLAG